MPYLFSVEEKFVVDASGNTHTVGDISGAQKISAPNISGDTVRGNKVVGNQLSITGNFNLNSGAFPLIDYAEGSHFSIVAPDNAFSIDLYPTRTIYGIYEATSSLVNKGSIVFQDNPNSDFAGEPYVSGFHIDASSLRVNKKLIGTGVQNIGNGQHLVSGQNGSIFYIRSVSGGSGLRINNSGDYLLLEVTGIGGGSVDTSNFLKKQSNFTSGFIAYGLSSDTLTGNSNFVYSGNKVGIGTSTPSTTLDVNGLIRSNNTTLGQINTKLYGRGDGGNGTYGHLAWYGPGGVAPLGLLSDDSSYTYGLFGLYGNTAVTNRIGEWDCFDHEIGGPDKRGSSFTVDKFSDNSYGISFFTINDAGSFTSRTAFQVNTTSAVGGVVAVNPLSYEAGLNANFTVFGNAMIGIDLVDSAPPTNGLLVQGDIISSGNIFVTDKYVLTGASDMGGGSGLFSSTSANTLLLKSLKGGSGIRISGDSDSLTLIVTGIAGGVGGGIDGASNGGTGIGIFSGQNGNTLVFKSITGIDNLHAHDRGSTIDIALNSVISGKQSQINLLNNRISGFDIFVSATGISKGDQRTLALSGNSHFYIYNTIGVPVFEYDHDSIYFQQNQNQTAKVDYENEYVSGFDVYIHGTDSLIISGNASKEIISDLGVKAFYYLAESEYYQQNYTKTCFIDHNGVSFYGTPSLSGYHLFDTRYPKYSLTFWDGQNKLTGDSNVLYSTGTQQFNFSNGISIAGLVDVKGNSVSIWDGAAGQGISLLVDDIFKIYKESNNEINISNSTISGFSIQTDNLKISGYTINPGGFVNLPVQSVKLPPANACIIDASERNWRVLYPSGANHSGSWQLTVPFNYHSDPILRILYTTNLPITGVGGSGRLTWAAYCFNASPDDIMDINTGAHSLNSEDFWILSGLRSGDIRMATLPITTPTTLEPNDYLRITLARHAASTSVRGDVELVGLTFEYR